MSPLDTIQPEYLEKIIAHANEVRMAPDGEKQQRESIEISPFWEEQLKAMPYLSSKYLLDFWIVVLLPTIEQIHNARRH